MVSAFSLVLLLFHPPFSIGQSVVSINEIYINYAVSVIALGTYVQLSSLFLNEAEFSGILK